jgi:hypothetical protein
MSSMLGPLPVYAWVLIAVALVAIVLVAVRWSSAPKELAGIDVTPGAPATLTLTTAPSDTLRVWGRYELGTDDEDAEVRVSFEARSAGRVVASGDVGRNGARIWHGGTLNRESYTDAVTTVSGVSEGAPFELRVTIRATAPVLKARLYVSR